MLSILILVSRWPILRSLFFVFREQIELYERVSSARKFLAMRERKDKNQMEISYAIS
jgi:hypothetical protein